MKQLKTSNAKNSIDAIKHPKIHLESVSFIMMMGSVMNKELIISETEQFINDEIFYIQIEYGEKETANERFYLNTAKRLTKALFVI